MAAIWFAKVSLLDDVCAVGKLDSYRSMPEGLVHLKFEDGREYITHWCNVIITNK